MSTSVTGKRLVELGIELPQPFPPVALYVPATRVGELIYVSGTAAVRPDGSIVIGKVGDRPGDLDEDSAREAARLAALQFLGVLQAEVGDLDKVVRVIKVLGMVNCAPGFNRCSTVIDGFSQVLIDVLGERGRAARSAVGMAELPFDIPVEIEGVVHVRD
jgi:enamine deaminase RidA (YjgF/YER057c/UK114 family)